MCNKEDYLLGCSDERRKHQITERRIAKESNLHIHRRENLKSHKM
jgi:hypothetical protein